MSNTDRLREAADRLDWDASYMQPGDFPELQQERQAKTATAALLRAVADSHEDYGYSGPYCAALALTDVILGVTDE